MNPFNDIRYAARSLSKVPGFAGAVILTLALGIGANTAIFSVVRGALLRPLPNRDGEHLVYLRQSAKGTKLDNVAFSVPEIIDYRTAATTLQGFAQYSKNSFVMLGRDEPTRVQAGVVTGNYFSVMGLAPVAGRLFDSHDDGPTAAPAIVLSHVYWLQRFGGDRGVVGQTVRLNGRPATIVGVVQDAPRYPTQTDVFVNMVTSPHHLSATMIQGRTHRMTEIFARLAAGATLQQAQSEITRIATTVHADHPDVYEQAAGYAVSVRPLRDVLNERATLTFWLLMGASAFVLLIACANVANLTLMRGIRRERELVVRRAMGAGAARLRRLLLAENLLLAVTGGALGVGIAYAGLGGLVTFASQLTPRGGEIRVDGVVLVFTLAIAVGAAVVLAFVPHVGAEGALAASLVSAGRRTTAGRRRQRLQRGLVVVQVAVCVVLLTGAGLLVRTLMRLRAVDAGVDAESVLTVDVPTEGTGRSDEQRLAQYELMRDRVAALPGVTVAALGSNVPLRGSAFNLDVKAEGRALASGEPTPHAEFRTVDPEYFRAVRIPVLQGREFLSTDRVGSPSVVILNESLAKELFGVQNPVGRRVAWTGDVLRFLAISGDWRTVVGVVGDTREAGLDADPAPAMYLPFAQGTFTGSLMIRTKVDPAALIPAVTRTLRSLDPQQLVENVRTLLQVRNEGVAPRRVNAQLVTAFGGLALVIAAVGIAGVLAFSVSSRTNEIGIRMSLGANASRVQRMVLGEGWVLLALGLIGGAVGALGATRLLGALLYGVVPNDPLTLGTVMAVMGLVGTLACWIPAARAARVDPGVALRAE